MARRHRLMFPLEALSALSLFENNISSINNSCVSIDLMITRDVRCSMMFGPFPSSIMFHGAVPISWTH